MIERLRKLVEDHGTQYPKVLRQEQNKDLLSFVLDNSKPLDDPKYRLAQRIEWVLARRTDFPRCKNPNCNKPLDKPSDYRGLHFGYREHCCMKCSTSDPVVVARNQQTTMERHGSSTYRNDSQRRKTCFAKYGVDNNMKSKDGYARYKASLSKNYGVDNVFQCCDVKAKSAATKKAKYGDVNYNNPDKRAATNIAKYGYTSATLSPEVMARSREKYFYDGRYFSSSWEIAYYIWLTDNGISFEYQPKTPIHYVDANGKKRRYYPDFNIGGQIVEIKGDHFFDKTGAPVYTIKNISWKAKYDAMIEHGVKILLQRDIKPYLRYVRDKYGRGYLKSFKNSHASNKPAAKIQDT